MRLKTFGRLALEGGELTRQKPLLLLAYLAVEGPKPRRYLAELFFMAASDPLNSLSRALSYLRKDAPGSVETDNTRAWATVESDAASFMNQADAGALAACAALYQGAFAEDLNIPLSPELEEWIYGIREYLAGRYREVLLRLAEEEAAAGKLPQAASRAESAYTLPGAPELEPDHFERIYRLLAAGSNPRAAEVRAEAEGYGIPLTLTAQEARAAFVPSGSEAVIPNNLPPPKTSFVGRDRELGDIAELLANPECRLLTLHGMGGVGKSRLALKAAQEQLKQLHFKDGVYFVPLDALASADLVPSAIAEHMSLKLQGQEEVLIQVKRHIGNKRMLFILDNYEHLMEAATLPSQVLEACPNLKLIVTSRERLNLQEEQVLVMGGLPVLEGEAPTLQEAKGSEAVQLFVQRAKLANLSYVPTHADLLHILTICRLVEGSPLALELASAWTKVLSVGDLAQELERDLDVLSSPERNRPLRHQSIRLAFEHSWRLLSPREREALQRLSVFRGGFRREAAAFVVGASLPILAALSDKALLRVLASGRYDRHPLLHHYAAQKLEEAPQELAAMQGAHQDYFLRFLRERYADPERFTEIDAELSNLLRALETARQSAQDETFVEMMRLLLVGKTGVSYLGARGHTPYMFQLIKTAVDKAKSLQDWEAAHYLLSRLGDLYDERLSAFDEAFKAYSEALLLAQRLKDRNREIVLLSLIGVQQFHRDQPDADACFESAAHLAQHHGDERALFVVMQHQGFVAFFRQDWEGMRRFSLQALEVAAHLEKRADVERGEVNHKRVYGLRNLSKAEFKLGNFESALERCREALEVAQEQKNEIWQALTLDDLGEIHDALGERVAAEENLRRALALYEKNHVETRVAALKAFLEAKGYGLSAEVA